VSAVPEHFDLVIVGAGPAGLVTAAMIAITTQKRVLVIDKGDDIERREAHEPREWVEGIGGAGLYSDGKLCMSLDVGGHLREELPPAEKSRLLLILDELFRWAVGGPASLKHFIAPISEITDAQGVTLTRYPVLHIGTDRGADVIRQIVGLLQSRGVVMRSRCELLNVKRELGSGWELTLSRESSIHSVQADALVLAMGKVGSQRQAEICEQQGAILTSVPMYLGVRLECDSETLRTFFADSLDPKIKLAFPDGTRMKTHCATLEGEIAPLHYEGLPLAGGHGYTDRRTRRGGFAILWDGIRTKSSFDYAKSLMTLICKRTGGKLLVQRLDDFLNGQASSAQSVSQAHPSVWQWMAGDIAEFYPEAFTGKLREFVSLIKRRVPDLDISNALLFAPAIEWWMRRVKADARTMQSAAGIYVCGDGSGWSQGIVHAAATGIIAAEDLIGRKVSVSQLSDYLDAQVPRRPGLNRSSASFKYEGGCAASRG
jgi:uncharacterized protein